MKFSHQHNTHEQYHIPSCFLVTTRRKKNLASVYIKTSCHVQIHSMHRTKGKKKFHTWWQRIPKPKTDPCFSRFRVRSSIRMAYVNIMNHKVTFQNKPLKDLAALSAYRVVRGRFFSSKVGRDITIIVQNFCAVGGVSPAVPSPQRPSHPLIKMKIRVLSWESIFRQSTVFTSAGSSIAVAVATAVTTMAVFPALVQQLQTLEESWGSRRFGGGQRFHSRGSEKKHYNQTNWELP